MWAEMQLEKRRHKEELLSRSHFPLLPDTVRIDGESPNPGNMASGTLSPFDQGQLDMNVPNTDGAGLGEALAGNGKSSNGLSNGLVAYEAGTSVGATRGSHLAEKSRSQAKADIGLRAEELYVFRSQPLGSDRRHNRYWQFVTGNGGQDPGCGRLFFESNSDGHWGVIDTEEVRLLPIVRMKFTIILCIGSLSISIHYRFFILSTYTLMLMLVCVVSVT